MTREDQEKNGAQLAIDDESALADTIGLQPPAWRVAEVTEPEAWPAPPEDDEEAGP